MTITQEIKILHRKIDTILAMVICMATTFGIQSKDLLEAYEELNNMLYPKEKQENEFLTKPEGKNIFEDPPLDNIINQ